GAVDPANDIRLKGVFVSAVVPTQVNLYGYDKLTSVRKTYVSWDSMATANPFATLFCQCNSDAAPPKKVAQLDTMQAATDDNSKCQKLDIIVVFDTSQSVVEPFIRNYADFSVQFISQYTLTGAVDGDNTRTGIISFSSDVKTVRDLGERPLSDFKAAVNGIHYTGGTTNTLAAMKAGRDMFKQGGGTTHGRTMVFLSDGEPYPLTPDTWVEIMSVGSELQQMGVDIFFVGDGNGYDASTRK
ncbi:von Willebrand factor type A domain protein, partial [Teladorsagia circumcincta]